MLSKYHIAKSGSAEKNCINSYRFGFNGQEKDNEIKGIGNSLDFKFRMYDSRLGRFFSVDPLASKYPGYSTYGFAQNSPISGIDLEGLEYLGHNEARVEFKYGQLRLKVENFHTINRNAWNRANNDPSNWKPGEIGLNRTLGNVSFISPQPPTPSASDITNVGAAAPVDRYQSNIASNKHDQRPGIVGPAGKGGPVTKTMIAIDAIKTGLESYVQWAGKDDADLVDKHRQIAVKVGADMREAISRGMIPDKYMNRESITNIMNVVLQGENNTSDPGIYQTGMDIYNMANPKQTEFVPSGMDNFPGRVVPVQQPATSGN